MKTDFGRKQLNSLHAQVSSRKAFERIKIFLQKYNIQSNDIINEFKQS